MFISRLFRSLMFATGLATITFMSQTIPSTQAFAKTHEVSMTAVETDVIIDGSGEKYGAWTFKGQRPGPVVRRAERGTPKVALTNQASNYVSTAMDFYTGGVAFLYN